MKNAFAFCVLAGLCFASAQAQQQPSVIVTPGGVSFTSNGVVITSRGVGVLPEGVEGNPSSPKGEYTPPYLPQGGVLGLMGATVITPRATPVPQISANCPAPVQMVARNWMGQTEYQATNAARLSGSNWRVVRRDGERFAVTQDFSESRLNFEFDQGRLTRLTCG
jgi:hypothetical protein